MKTNKRWTVMLVPHGSGGSRAFRVSRRAARWVLGTLGVLALAATVFGYATVSKAINLSRLDRLELTNDLLSQEIDLTRAQLAELTDTLDAITRRDREVRLLAGLEPTDADVQMAGIGGPLGLWTDREQLLAEGSVGQAAIDMRLDIGSLIRRANLLAGSFDEAADSLRGHLDRLSRTPSIMPTSGFLSSTFARERIHPIYHEARAHEGIDISAAMGTPILAAAGGRIVDVRTLPGYGKIVTVDHGYGVVTRYAHCSRILVRAGERVSRGDEVALVGSTGITTAPHLHYEVIVRGRQVNPMEYIFPETIVD
ncbi:MAG TPA: M23 family metallopeptidase [Gemmatimonadales bacterium]